MQCHHLNLETLTKIEQLKNTEVDEWDEIQVKLGTGEL